MNEKRIKTIMQELKETSHEKLEDKLEELGFMFLTQAYYSSDPCRSRYGAVLPPDAKRGWADGAVIYYNKERIFVFMKDQERSGCDGPSPCWAYYYVYVYPPDKKYYTFKEWGGCGPDGGTIKTYYSVTFQKDGTRVEERANIVEY